MAIDATVVAVAVEKLGGVGAATTAFATSSASPAFGLGVAVATTSATSTVTASTTAFVTFVTFAGPARLGSGSAFGGNVTHFAAVVALGPLDIGSGVLLDTDFTQSILELEVGVFSKTRADEELREVVERETPSEFLSLGDGLDTIVRRVVDTVKKPFGLFRFVGLILTMSKQAKKLVKLVNM
jgi:hypothetical protein